MRISDWSSDVCSSDLTPVMVDEERGQLLIDSNAIAEYFEETVEGKAMINGTAAQRAEIRRLVAWLDQDFYYEVTGPLLFELVQHRIVHPPPPALGALHQPINAAHNHLAYIAYPIPHHPWTTAAAMTTTALASHAPLLFAHL